MPTGRLTSAIHPENSYWRARVQHESEAVKLRDRLTILRLHRLPHWCAFETLTHWRARGTDRDGQSLFRLCRAGITTIAVAAGVVPRASECGLLRSSSASGGAIVVLTATHIRYVRPAWGTTNGQPVYRSTIFDENWRLLLASIIGGRSFSRGVGAACFSRAIGPSDAEPRRARVRPLSPRSASGPEGARECGSAHGSRRRPPEERRRFPFRKAECRLA